MASRFTHGSTADKTMVAPGLFDPLSSPAVIEAARAQKLKEEEEAKRKLEQERIQKEGHIVHEVTVWYPEKLLCKRFNCPDPHPNRVKVCRVSYTHVFHPTSCSLTGHTAGHAGCYDTKRTRIAIPVIAGYSNGSSDPLCIRKSQRGAWYVMY
jgi:hypothetical protein